MDNCSSEQINRLKPFKTVLGTMLGIALEGMGRNRCNPPKTTLPPDHMANRYLYVRGIGALTGSQGHGESHLREFHLAACLGRLGRAG